MSKRYTILAAALLMGAAVFPALAQDAPAPDFATAVAADDAVAAAPPGPDQADMAAAHAHQPGRLSLLDMLRTSYESNPTILAARAELMATQERLPQAQAGWKPSVDANAAVTRVDNDFDNAVPDTDGTEKTFGVDASQPIYRGGRTISGIDSAKNAIMAQRAFLIAAEQDVLLQVVTAYMNVLRDQSLYNLAVNNREVIERQAQATQARFDVGDVTRTDVSQSQARLALAEATRVRAMGNLRGSLAVFQQVTGMQVTTGLGFPDMRLPLPDGLEAAVELAEKFNPSVLAAEFLHNAAQKDIDTVFGELLPSVGLFASWDIVSDPVGSAIDRRTTTAVGIQATVPLYEAGATRSRVRAAKNTAVQRRIEVTEAVRLARQQAVSNWESWRAAETEIASRRAQVEASRVARDGVQKEAELGTRTILDSLDADQELLDAESALVTAQRNEVVARFALAATLGMMTPEILGFPELAQDYNVHLREITGKIFSTGTDFGSDLAEKARN